MSFTDGKLRVATKEDCQAAWGGAPNGKYFKCMFCGYKFKEGDKWRFQYTNDIPNAGGNPLVCESCDEGPEKTREKWVIKVLRFKEILNANENWWLRKYYTTEG